MINKELISGLAVSWVLLIAILNIYNFFIKDYFYLGLPFLDGAIVSFVVIIIYTILYLIFNLLTKKNTTNIIFI